MSNAQYTNKFATDRFYQKVGETITKAREDAGLRQCDLADRAKLAKSTIYHAETGESCSLYVLAKIAEALDTTLDELVPTEAT